MLKPINARWHLQESIRRYTDGYATAANVKNLDLCRNRNRTLYRLIASFDLKFYHADDWTLAAPIPDNKDALIAEMETLDLFQQGCSLEPVPWLSTELGINAAISFLCVCIKYFYLYNYRNRTSHFYLDADELLYLYHLLTEKKTPVSHASYIVGVAGIEFRRMLTGLRKLRRCKNFEALRASFDPVRVG